MSWEEGSKEDVDLSGSTKVGALVRCEKADSDAVKKFAGAVEVEGPANEGVYFIPSLTVAESKGIKCKKIIFTEENYIIS